MHDRLHPLQEPSASALLPSNQQGKARAPQILLYKYKYRKAETKCLGPPRLWSLYFHGRTLTGGCTKSGQGSGMEDRPAVHVVLSNSRAALLPSLCGFDQDPQSSELQFFPDQEVAVRRAPGWLAVCLLGDVRAESFPEHGKFGVLLQALRCSRCTFYGDVAKCHAIAAMTEVGVTYLQIFKYKWSFISSSIWKISSLCVPRLYLIFIIADLKSDRLQCPNGRFLV